MEKICPICHKKFEAQSSGTEYCSPTCKPFNFFVGIDQDDYVIISSRNGVQLDEMVTLSKDIGSVINQINKLTSATRNLFTIERIRIRNFGHLKNWSPV
jgi:endogenous inhibitor of DNA gyrase (YacG/DUF329 family)